MWIPKIVQDVGKNIDGEEGEKLVGGKGDKELEEMGDGNCHSFPQNGNTSVILNVI